MNFETSAEFNICERNVEKKIDDVLRCNYMLIKEMVALQNKFNTETNGDTWRDGITKENKRIDWFLCITSEIHELIDSTPWKHWKSLDIEPDFDNIRIELTDLWHFILSEYISSVNISIVEIENKLSHYMYKHILDTHRRLVNYGAISKNSVYLNYIDFGGEVDVHGIDYNYVFIQICKELNRYASQENIDGVLEAFLKLIVLTPDFNFEKLYKMYIGKNALNQFRQLNGYKEGTYHKMWLDENGNEIEDNVILNSILDNISVDNMSYFGVQQSLSLIYNAQF